MKKQDATREDAAGAASPGTTIEAKIAWIERSQAALDERGIAVLREVFPTVMRTHYDSAMRRILKWGVDPNEAEDVVQEVFDSLFRHVAQRGAQPGLRKNLRCIARGKLLHYVRARRCAPESVALPSSGSSLPESEPDLNRAVDLRAIARRLLPELSEAHRAVVERCILADQTCAEAATTLGIPLATLKAQLAAAKRELRILAAPWLPPSQRNAA